MATNRWAGRLVLAASLGLVVAACGRTEDPRANEDVVAEVAPDPPPSPVEETRAKSGEPISDPAGASALASHAESLREWAEEHPEHDDAAEARLLAARLDLFAAGGRLGLTDDPNEAAVSRSALDGILDQLVVAGEAGADDEALAEIRAAVAALAALDPEAEEAELDRDAALALATGASELSQVVRVAWAMRLAEGLDTLRASPPELRVEATLARVGRLLCPGCDGLGDAAPHEVSRRLLDTEEADGIVCRAALDRVREDATPAGLAKALSACEGLVPEGHTVEPTLLWGENALVLGLARTAARLAESPEGKGPLARIAEARVSDLRGRLEAPLVLPVPYITEPLPDPPADAEGDAPPDDDGSDEAPGDEPTREHLAPFEGLGEGGLSVTNEALGLFLVGPSEIRAGLRPVVAFREGRPVSVGAERDLPAGGRSLMTLAELEEALPADGEEAEDDEEEALPEGAIPAIHDAAAAIRTAEEKLAEDLEPKPALGTDEDGRFAVLGVDALAPGWAVDKLLAALGAAGVDHVRLHHPTGRGALPLIVREAPAGLAEDLEVGYARPTVVVIGGEHVDIWGPTDRVDEADPETDTDRERPEDVEPGYHLEDLVRLRVTLPEAAERGLTEEAADKILESVAFFQGRSGAGPVIHVVAGQGALAADVLRIADRFQRAEGDVLEDPGTIWPGTRCGGPADEETGREPEGCPTGVAVAFSATGPPSVGAVRGEPWERRARPAPKPKKEAPPAGFCEERDIAVNMNRQKGAFRFCYERELQLDENLAGRVVLRFTIAQDGSVTKAHVASSTLENERVHDCLVRTVRRVTFAKPDGGVCAVSWPFSFR